MDAEQLKKIVEAAILVADAPLSRDALLALFDEDEQPNRAELSKVLESLGDDYAERGIELREVASGYRFQARTELGPWVSRLWQEKPPRYSRAVLETLSLVAYRQPITRSEIEEIRGVSVSSHIVKSLLERNWVRIVGHRDVPGRPAMFATTRQFLDYFDLKSLEDLPPLAEIKDLDKINEELALSDAPSQDEQQNPVSSARSESDQNDTDPESTTDPATEPQEAANEDTALRLPGDQETIPGLEQEEPEIDESTLMSMTAVDDVLDDFETQFRRKPGHADAATNARSGDSHSPAASPDTAHPRTEDDPSPHE